MEQSRAKCAILVLCGLPASGKTTLAQNIAKAVSSGNGGPTASSEICQVRVISFDDILHSQLLADGQFSPEAWRHCRREALVRLTKSLDELRDQTDTPHGLVIADDNCHLRSMRYELFQLARDRGAAFLQLYVHCELREALARNSRRSGLAAVPQDVLTRMAAALEPPQPERFAWEAQSITFTTRRSPGEPPAALDGVGWCAPHQVLVGPEEGAPQRERMGEPHQRPGTACAHGACDPEPGGLQELPDGCLTVHTVAELLDKIWRLWGPPAPPPPSEEDLRRQLEEGRAANSASYLHALDLRTRKALGEAVAASGAGADRAARARDLNERRRGLLQAARELLMAGEHEGQSRGGWAAEGGTTGGVGGGVMSRLLELEEEFMRAARV